MLCFELSRKRHILLSTTFLKRNNLAKQDRFDTILLKQPRAIISQKALCNE